MKGWAGGGRGKSSNDIFFFKAKEGIRVWPSSRGLEDVYRRRLVFFPEGIMGWLRQKKPAWFGEVVDSKARLAQVKINTND